jgi:hypothetical protein
VHALRRQGKMRLTIDHEHCASVRRGFLQSQPTLTECEQQPSEGIRRVGASREGVTQACAADQSGAGSGTAVAHHNDVIRLASERGSLTRAPSASQLRHC